MNKSWRKGYTEFGKRYYGEIFHRTLVDNLIDRKLRASARIPHPTEDSYRYLNDPPRTPRPTKTFIPSATPYPPLQTDGLYLLFQKDENNLMMLDADGMGR